MNFQNEKKNFVKATIFLKKSPHHNDRLPKDKNRGKSSKRGKVRFV